MPKKDVVDLELDVQGLSLAPKQSILVAPPPEEQGTPQVSLHPQGDACAQHFLAMITEGSHQDRIHGLVEEGNTAEQVMIALLKSALDSDTWHAARTFMEEAGGDVQRGSGDVIRRPCLFCRCDFLPERAGQRYCCNACAYRAEGGVPGAGCHAFPFHVHGSLSGNPSRESLPPKSSEYPWAPS